MSEPGIALADVIDAVRAELETAARRAIDQPLQFDVEDIQLEVEVTTTGTREAEGGIKIWVLSLGAKGSKTAGGSHKVSLRLSPVSKTGAKFKVSDISKPVRRR
ncbi:MAG: trypco2 family protein [Acidimicrobiia bacterium]